MNPTKKKSMSTLVIQPSFRALGQKQAKWQTFEKPENMRQMCGSQSIGAWLPCICLIFSAFSNSCHFPISHVFVPQLLKLSRVANFGMSFLMMWLICLSDKNEFMLIIVAAIFRIGLLSFVNFCLCSIVPGITGLHCVRTVKTPTPSSER